MRLVEGGQNIAAAARSLGVERDDALLVHIKAIHAETRGGHGWPRTWKELLARGIREAKERVQKLMKLHGIRTKGRGSNVIRASRAA